MCQSSVLALLRQTSSFSKLCRGGTEDVVKWSRTDRFGRVDDNVNEACPSLKLVEITTEVATWTKPHSYRERPLSKNSAEDFVDVMPTTPS